MSPGALQLPGGGARNPAGTVVEIGTGLNTRFERVDNGQAHWIDRFLLPLAEPVLGRAMRVTLLQA